jgi:hypothetical protein
MSANTVARSRDCAHARGLLHLEKGSELIDSRGRRPQVTSLPRSIGLHGLIRLNSRSRHDTFDRSVAVARVDRGPLDNEDSVLDTGDDRPHPSHAYADPQLGQPEGTFNPAKPSPRVLASGGIDTLSVAG